MDGTLLPKTTALLELAKELNLSEELLVLEQRFAAKEINPKQLARLIFNLWGVVDEDTSLRVFNKAPKLKHIKEVVEDIHRSGGLAAVITLSPDFFANHFLAYGFDHVYASQFPKDENTAFDPGLILNPEAKPMIAKKLHEDKRLGKPAIIAYGDSLSDVPMFEQANVSISVNGDAHLEQLATYHYKGDDLWEAYKLASSSVISKGVN